MTNSPDTGNLENLHAKAEEKSFAYGYVKPTKVVAEKAFINLGRSDILRGLVQVVKKDGGENNLHYHTKMDSFWMVLKGRVRFYGPGDVVIGEFGPYEGTITPRFSRYWFENIGDTDLELLQVAAYTQGATDGGRTDASAQRFRVGSADKFDASTSKSDK